MSKADRVLPASSKDNIDSPGSDSESDLHGIDIDIDAESSHGLRVCTLSVSVRRENEEATSQFSRRAP